MKTTSEYKYYGSFVDKFGNTYLLNIEAPDLTEDVEVTFGADPLHMTWDESDLLCGAVSKSLDIQLVGNFDYSSLYSEDPLGIAVKVWKNGEIWFYGFMARSEYDQTFSDAMHTFTFEALDVLSVAKDLQYCTTTLVAGKTLFNIVSSFRSVVGIDSIFSHSEIASNTTNINTVAFYPEFYQGLDADDDSLEEPSWADVLQKLAISFSAVIFEWQDQLYVLRVNELDPGTAPEIGTSWPNCETIKFSYKDSTGTTVNVPWMVTNRNIENITHADNIKESILKSYSRANFTAEDSVMGMPFPDPFEESRFDESQNYDYDTCGMTDVGTLIYQDDDDLKRVYFRATDQSTYNKDYYGSWGQLIVFERESSKHVWGEPTDIKVAFSNIHQQKSFRFKSQDVSKMMNFNISYFDDEDGTFKSSTFTSEQAGFYEFIIYAHYSGSGTSWDYYNDIPEGTGYTAGIKYSSYYITGISLTNASDFKLEERSFKLNSKSIDKITYNIAVSSKSENGSFSEFAITTDELKEPTWLGTPHREFTITSYDENVDVAPYRACLFRDMYCQVVGADIDARNAEVTMKIQEYGWKRKYTPSPEPEPTPEPTSYTLVSMDSVTLTSNSAQVTVPGAGGSFPLYVRIGCTISDGTNSFQYTGTVEGLSSYGISAAFSIESEMEIAHEEVEQRGYSISGYTITFDEWPLAEIDERVVYVWATCAGVKSGEIEFTQYPEEV